VLGPQKLVRKTAFSEMPRPPAALVGCTLFSASVCRVNTMKGGFFQTIKEGEDQYRPHSRAKFSGSFSHKSLGKVLRPVDPLEQTLEERRKTRGFRGTFKGLLTLITRFKKPKGVVGVPTHRPGAMDCFPPSTGLPPKSGRPPPFFFHFEASTPAFSGKAPGEWTKHTRFSRFFFTFRLHFSSAFGTAGLALRGRYGLAATPLLKPVSQYPPGRPLEQTFFLSIVPFLEACWKTFSYRCFRHFATFSRIFTTSPLATECSKAFALPGPSPRNVRLRKASA